MNVLWTPRAWEDYVLWHTTDLTIARKINAIVTDMRRSPFRGLGKPEPLKNNLAKLWARRITAEHRLVYRVVGSGEEQRIEIVQCRYHY